MWGSSGCDALLLYIERPAAVERCPDETRINMPQFNMPQFNMPQFNMPQFNMPQRADT
jgi:hypothetical protein